ncbi:MAG: hypothetical protein AAGI14_13590 [Pseudomonadota bacterium]
MVRLALGIIGAVFVLAACASAQEKDNQMKRDDTAIFEDFKALSGTYLEVEGEGEPAIIEYRLISRGTALTETWIMPAGQYGPDGKTELTVFHMDSGVLVATHYCGVGVHPTMVLDPKSPDGTYNFIPRTIANLGSAEQSYNSGFGYTLEDDGTVYRSEQWMISGKRQESYLRMERDAH